jgi:hypothetical protein
MVVRAECIAMLILVTEGVDTKVRKVSVDIK